MPSSRASRQPEPQLSASVIIPTYNRRELLTRTLASLDRQSVPTNRYEVVVAIDGSTDGSLESLSDLHTNYRLRAAYEDNKGLAAARNLGAQHAENEVLIFLDDDQIATPDLVLAHLLAHERQERLFVQGIYPVAREYLTGGASLLYDRTYRSAMAETERLHRQGKRWAIWGGNFSLRAEIWREVGGSDPGRFRCYGHEDTDLGLRLAALGVAFHYEPRACSFHMHECSCRSLARQSYQEGRARAALAQKYDAALESLTVSDAPSTVDSAVLWACRRGPRAMRAAGATATAGLWIADRLPSQSLQVLAARVVRKLHKVRGAAAGPEQQNPQQARQARQGTAALVRPGDLRTGRAARPATSKPGSAGVGRNRTDQRWFPRPSSNDVVALLPTAAATGDRMLLA
jgi:GT2 family glycosyltransferase